MNLSHRTCPWKVTKTIFQGLLVLAAIAVFSLGTPRAAAMDNRTHASATARGARVQSTFDWRTDVAPASAFAPLLAKAQHVGSVRVIVGLKVLWTPEGRLSSAQRSAQRGQLTAATDALLATLQGQSY